MSTFQIATDDQITQLRARAVNATTREIMRIGVNLSHEQADDLGADSVAWIRGRLGLNVTTTDDGVVCTPPRRYGSLEDLAAGSELGDAS